jgi:hypothetical protein
MSETSTPETTMDNLKAASLKAYHAQMAAEKHYQDQKATLIVEVEEKLKPERLAWVRACEDRQKAEAAIRAEADRIRFTANESSIPYPEGTILYLWETRDKWNKNAHNAPMFLSPTGQKAVIQFFRNGDLVPDNTKWRRPLHGEVIIRVLNKDGKPGKRLERWDAVHNKDCWLPEGVPHQHRSPL